ncbi:MAG: thioredoxin-dependent thiol peroxidase [Leifsonia sp.]
MTESLRLQPGDTAPAFTLLDQDGRSVSLGDYAGRDVIVYFYPEAMTPGCTTQACDFRDNLASLAGAGYSVLGISKDPIAKLKRFQEEDAISFPLLSDESLSVHRAYGTWGEKNSYGRIVTGTLRSTFVIDAEGVIRYALYNVKATGHISMLRKKLGIDA